jgi:carboxyl-terminal processing protease
MKKYFLLVVLTLLLTGCKKTTNIFYDANLNLYNFMAENYYWKDKMPVVDPESYKDPWKLLNVLRYSPVDKWSYIEYDPYWMPVKWERFVTGFGITLGLDQNSDVRIATILEGSDLYSKGVRRGWILKTIEGVIVAPFVSSKDSIGLSNLYGSYSENVSRSFEFKNPDGILVSITARQSEIKNPILVACDTLHLSSGITGYINFNSFNDDFSTGVYPSLEFLKSCQVQNLIFDLRYNSEGNLETGKILASAIIGNDYHNQPWLKLVYNNAASDYVNFSLTNYSLGIKRVVFITSKVTSAGNEMLIAGLKPYIDVAVVGSRTAGNPYIMSYYKCMIKDKRLLYYYIVNAEGQSKDGQSFTEGIPADIQAVDDITHDFGDRKEACMAAAINYLETNR